MATYQQKTYSGNNYAAFRPTYSPSWFEYLRTFCGGTIDLAVDVGCGTGIATQELGNVAKEVIGVEPSLVMLEQAKSLNKKPNVKYIQGSDTDLLKLIGKDTADLLSVAEAAHWFTYPEFWDSLDIVKPNGTFALYGYKDVHILGYPQAVEALKMYSYSPEYLANYWDSGRQLLTDFYDDLTPPDNFKVEKRVVIMGDDPNYETSPLKIEKECKVEDIVRFLNTYSPLHNWRKANPGARDIVDQFKEDLERLGLRMDQDIKVRWDVIYILARKQS